MPFLQLDLRSIIQFSLCFDDRASNRFLFISEKHMDFFDGNNPNAWKAASARQKAIELASPGRPQAFCARKSGQTLFPISVRPVPIISFME